MRVCASVAACSCAGQRTGLCVQEGQRRHELLQVDRRARAGSLCGFAGSREFFSARTCSAWSTSQFVAPGFNAEKFRRPRVLSKRPASGCRERFCAERVGGSGGAKRARGCRQHVEKALGRR
eukprot:3367395-Rhodomonas_salina.1